MTPTSGTKAAYLLYAWVDLRSVLTLAAISQIVNIRRVNYGCLAQPGSTTPCPSIGRPRLPAPVNPISGEIHAQSHVRDRALVHVRDRGRGRESSRRDPTRARDCSRRHPSRDHAGTHTAARNTGNTAAPSSRRSNPHCSNSHLPTYWRDLNKTEAQPLWAEEAADN